MNELFKQFTYWINQLYGAPTVIIDFITCFMLGVVLKSYNGIKNEKIPLVLIFWSAFFYLGCANWQESKLALNIFICKNIAVGMVIGFLAPKIHSKYIKPWETKIPFVGNLLNRGNTTVFKKKKKKKHED